MSLTVLCLLKEAKSTEHGEASWWNDWGHIYLEKLANGVRRYLPGDTVIRCLTDRPAVMPAGVEPVPISGEHPGWWSKMEMFRPEVSS